MPRVVQPGPSPRDRCATFNCKGVMRPWDGGPGDYERQLACGDEPLVINAEEHSGQVPLETREQIEARFKDGELNLLVCAMTLELGVDLGQLLAVILRNVPPRDGSSVRGTFTASGASPPGAAISSTSSGMAR